jgi:hypothetical protein
VSPAPRRWKLAPRRSDDLRAPIEELDVGEGQARVAAPYLPATAHEPGP